jgi:multidrug efflux pump subunit AcrA (membrane-fusion protein)
MTKRKKLLGIFSSILVVALVVGGCYYYMSEAKANDEKNSKSDSNEPLDRTYTLKKGELVIGLIQSGSVNAKKKHKLSLQANFRTKLMWIIDENTKIKKGQVLAKFETEELKEKIDDMKIDYENLEKELMLAIESQKILESSNKSDIRSANDRVVNAIDALKKYRKFERSKQRDAIELKIQNAEATYDAAVDSYREFKNEVAQSGATDKDEEKKNEQKLKDLKNKVDSTKNSLDNAELDRKLFKRYTHPNKMTELVNSFEQAKLNMRKVKISTASQMIQKKKSIDNIRKRMKKIKDRLDKYISYVDMMKLVAPVDGVVIYGDPDRRWGNPDIKLGMDIWKRLILMTIPDMANLIIDFDLPEQYRSKVKIGDKVIISPDSLPGVKLRGKISKIATLPVNMIHWDQSSPKIYKSVITLDEQSDKLVSGMSVQVEIVTKVIKGTLFVPVEAVFEDNDRFFVYKKTFSGPKEVEVTIGESNDNYVQIEKGLQENDIVYLYRPYQKKDVDES